MPRTVHAGMYSEPHGRGRGRLGRLAPLAAIALGAAAFAAPANAAIVPPTGDVGITTFVDSNYVSVEGLPVPDGGRVDVLVRRDGTIIGQALAREVSGGVIEINHGPDECFEGSTPDILAGDTVEVITQRGTANTAPDGYTMTVANVTVQAPQRVGNTVTVSGTTTAASDTLEQRIIHKFSSARPRLEAPGDGTLTFPTPTTWTASYELGADEASAAMSGETTAIVLVGNSVTIADTEGVHACADAPVARTAMTAVSRDVVNIATQNEAITVSGVIQPDQTVTVRVNGAAPRPGQVDGGTWTASINAAEVRNLPQGASVISAAFGGPGAPEQQQTRTITKDTVAPGNPGATPGPGTYTTAQSVTLSSADGAQVRWTTGAGEPTTPFSAPIAVTATQTLKAVAVDGVGNRSGVQSFGYVIQPAAQGVGQAAAGGAGQASATNPAQGDSQPAGSGQDTGVTPVTGPSESSPLALRSLFTSSRVTRSRVLTRGIRLVMRLDEGTEVVRIRVLRKKRNGTKSLLASGFRTPSSTGLYRVRLRGAKLRRDLTPGSYEIQVTPGTSRTDLGRTARHAFKVTTR